MSQIKAAVITVSDSVHAGTRPDRSGPAVRERLEQLGWEVAVLECVPDEVAQISTRLATLADANRLSAIFTTGGTGVFNLVSKGESSQHKVIVAIVVLNVTAAPT